ncbi:SMODS and SLOG-associating 2TM effector domain-containing protein [Plasmodiophora brassicae]|uniref:SMODS and SLOG-associating 2TM effector domain-containing protein n=1 Tax=Plasmodiophora brassicae TaxID=37360 RepID=A0A0G4J0F7_PLABS|nr:hypothetical protein PBRA_001815 [Plasmodiophora brassicae]
MRFEQVVLLATGVALSACLHSARGAGLAGGMVTSAASYTLCRIVSGPRLPARYTLPGNGRVPAHLCQNQVINAIVRADQRIVREQRHAKDPQEARRLAAGRLEFLNDIRIVFGANASCALEQENYVRFNETLMRGDNLAPTTLADEAPSRSVRIRRQLTQAATFALSVMAGSATYAALQDRYGLIVSILTATASGAAACKLDGVLNRRLYAFQESVSRIVKWSNLDDVFRRQS